jgi:hypothetical protein
MWLSHATTDMTSAFTLCFLLIVALADSVYSTQRMVSTNLTLFDHSESRSTVRSERRVSNLDRTPVKKETRKACTRT